MDKGVAGYNLCCHKESNMTEVTEHTCMLSSVQFSSVAQLCPTLCDPMDCSPPGSSVHGDSPGKNTGVGFHALFQEIFPYLGIQPRSPAF